MIKLRKEFVSGAGGYSQAPGPLKYVQLDRTEGLPKNFAIYQRFYADGRPKDFEVFQIKIEKAGSYKMPNGAPDRVVVDDTEKYATNTCFGFTAWSFENEGAARWKFKKLASGNYIDIGEEPAPEPVTNEEPAVADAPATPAPVSSGRRGRPRVTPVELTLPTTIFSMKEFAALNNVEYIVAQNFFNANEDKFEFVKKERRSVKGPETRLFKVKSVTT
jgi:hypothetical protein